MRRLALGLAAFAGLSFGATAAGAQDITVGFVTSLSGPASSIGLNYEKGINAAYAYQAEVDGHKINLVKLDDGSDPSAATQNARKLVQQNHVDLMIGTSSAPGTNAMLTVANELKVPFIGVSPVNVPIPATGHPWGIAVPQTPNFMMLPFPVFVPASRRHGSRAGFGGRKPT